jgi:hypothetical protein
VLDERQQPGLRDEIDLAQYEDDRRADLLDDVEQVAIARSGFHRGIHDECEQIDFTHRFERDVNHAHVHAMRRLVDARRVHEDDLPVAIILHADHPRARGLRLVRDDRELLADDAIQQG